MKDITARQLTWTQSLGYYTVLAFVATCIVPGYTPVVITGFRHRGLKRFFETGDTRRLGAGQVPKIRRILARLNAAASVRDLAGPGLRLHPLKGSSQGRWAVDVDRNWRITFRFDENNCSEVDYEDYH